MMDDDLRQLDGVLRGSGSGGGPAGQDVPRRWSRERGGGLRGTPWRSCSEPRSIVVGASAGIATLGAATRPRRRASQETREPRLPSTACAAPDLRAEVSLDGADGIGRGLDPADERRRSDLHSRADRPCRSSTRRETRWPFRSLRASLKWQADGAPEPAGWPVVSLRPGSAASVRVRWSNACPQLSGPASWKLDPRERRRNPGRVGRGRQPRASLQRTFRAVHARGRTVRTPRRRLSRRLEERGTT